MVKRVEPIGPQAVKYFVFGLIVSSVLTVVLLFLSRRILSQDWLDLFDNKILLYIQNHFRSPMMDKTMLLITFLGSFKFYLIICPVFLFLLFKFGHRRESLILLACLLGGFILNSVLKVSFQRIRPLEFFLVIERGYSFPSAHAMVSLPFYGYLAYLYWRIIRKRSYLISGLAIILILGIGFSRMYLGVHWFSDVLAGYIGGAIWLYACLAALELSHYLKPPLRK